MTHTPFTPSRRRDGWTLARQSDFIIHLRTFGGVAAAAKAVGISGKSAYRLRDRSPAFAAAWDDALDEGRQRSFARAMDRGLNGYIVPIYRAGRQTGVRQQFDNRLAYAACDGQPSED